MLNISSILDGVGIAILYGCLLAGSHTINQSLSGSSQDAITTLRTDASFGWPIVSNYTAQPIGNCNSNQHGVDDQIPTQTIYPVI
jgi:hypothetical protein